MSLLDTSVLNWDQLTQEAVRHLQALLRCNTTNPPGNEGPAISYICEQLGTTNIELRIIEPTPGRPNLWARLRGNGRQRPLLLVSHVDVVPVERDKWSFDPFGAEIHEGYVYGRGAVDMKSMTAKEMTIMLQLARELQQGRHYLSRDVIMLAVADEEMSGAHGMAWIARHEPDFLDAEFAINEGGGFAFEIGGRRIYLCETAQKGSAQVTLRAQGEPGHAAVPHQKNAIVHLARALKNLASTPLPLHITPTTRLFINALAATQTNPTRTLLPLLLNPLLSERTLALLPDVQMANALRAMLHNTVTPTILQAGQALNVIPGEAEAQLDGRLIPGQSADMLTKEIRQRINDSRVQVEVAAESPGHACDANTELFRAFSAAIAMYDAGSLVLPYLLPAVTDSRFLVPKGVIAYGFDPMRPEPGWPAPQELEHSHDERISVENVGFGLKVLYDTAKRLCR
jgi:acetylornithine deacetylase/succinyl-diaminopimelate desuccinylase-like protein